MGDTRSLTSRNIELPIPNRIVIETGYGLGIFATACPRSVGRRSSKWGSRWLPVAVHCSLVLKLGIVDRFSWVTNGTGLTQSVRFRPIGRSPPDRW